MTKSEHFLRVTAPPGSPTPDPHLEGHFIHQPQIHNNVDGSAARGDNGVAQVDGAAIPLDRLNQSDGRIEGRFVASEEPTPRARAATIVVVANIPGNATNDARSKTSPTAAGGDKTPPECRVRHAKPRGAVRSAGPSRQNGSVCGVAGRTRQDELAPGSG
ncbi:unnamed protein product [Lampetra fluviatilis]